MDSNIDFDESIFANTTDQGNDNDDEADDEGAQESDTNKDAPKLLKKKILKAQKPKKLDPDTFPMNFILCTLKRADRPADEKPTLHFH